VTHNPLDYRDGHEQTDVSPVLIDRFPGGGVRIVVTYPRDVRAWARTRFFIAVGAVIAWAMLTTQLMRINVWWGVVGSGWWPIAPGLAIVMAALWRQTYRLYVLEATPREITLETHGGLLWRRVRQQTFQRAWIKDVRVERNRRGRAVAITIVVRGRRSPRLFDGMDERHVTLIADALLGAFQPSKTPISR
jgi:hypothetical protein